MSTNILRAQSEILRDEFVMLPLTDMAKRESLGKRLYEARKALGLTARDLSEKIKQDYRVDCGETTIRYIEQGKTSNPGIKTIEFHALGVGLDPLEVIALALDEPPPTDPGFTESQFALLARAYKQVSKNQKPVADELVKMLIEKFERWR